MEHIASASVNQFDSLRAIKNGHQVSTVQDDPALPLTNDLINTLTPGNAVSKEPLVFSTWRAIQDGPNKNVEMISKDSFVIRMDRGQTLTIMGEYDLQVKSGIVIMQGATLDKTSGRRKVYNAATDPLLPLRCHSNGDCKIQVWFCSASMSSLGKVSKDFRGIWHVKGDDPLSSRIVSAADVLNVLIFDLIMLQLANADDDRLQRPLQLLHQSTDWQHAMASRIKTPKYSDHLAVLVTGSKGVGKSTFAKTLANFCNECKELTNSTVCWLDLDPGQPEFSPPGQLSLVLLDGPIFGPSYTHCFRNSASAFGHRVLKAHNLGANSPKDNPEFYLAAAADLLSHYNRGREHLPWRTLMINCPGWVTGDGLELTKQLILRTTPTHVVYILDRALTQISVESTIAYTSIETLRDSTAAADIPFITLPSGAIPGTTHIRTALDRRHMSSLSYFHRDPEYSEWTAQPLSQRKPWTVPYTSILGIFFTSGRPAPQFSYRAIHTSILAVVCLESSAADTVATSNTITQEGPEGLPYFPTCSQGLLDQIDPSTSRCVGFVYVQGINVKRRELHLVTPLGAQSRERALEKTKRGTPRFVLQAPGFGAYDAPTWAHLEEIVLRESSESAKQRRQQQTTNVNAGSKQQAEEDLSVDWVGEGDMEMDEETSDEEAGNEVVEEEPLPPYVEMVGMDAAPAKVWRDRKNIGTGRKTRS